MRDDCKSVKDDYENGPCRETASSVIQRAILWYETKIEGLRHLLKIAERLENGSPAEEMLWELLQSNHNLLR